MTVKIQDLDAIGQVISRTTIEGVNRLGVMFTSEDEEEIKAQAQEVAIADARQKAERLAKSLGVGWGVSKRLPLHSSP